MNDTKWTIVAVLVGGVLIGGYVWNKAHQANVAEATKDLVRAAAEGDVDRARQLIADGADVNGADPNGITPLQAAVGCDHVEMADFLVDQGARPETVNGGQPQRRPSYG